jgi:large subunit ribosomal protein L13
LQVLKYGCIFAVLKIVSRKKLLCNQNQEERVDTLSYKTVSANKETVNKGWVVVDAENQSLGRVASAVAKMLRGKHKPEFTPHVDCGDNVIVINAEKVQLTGNKWSQKTYIRYSGYPGGQRSMRAEEMLAKKPKSIMEHAVQGMLPKNRLGHKLMGNLYVNVGGEHKHEAQKPKEINLNTVKL